MTTTVDDLPALAAQLVAVWGHGDVAGMADAVALDVQDRIAALKRRLDGMHAVIAGEIAVRSRAELGKDGLARKAGHRTPEKLIAAATGGHPGDARRLVQVGEATRGRLQLSGEMAPPKYPAVAAALSAGRLSVAAACAITSMLDRVALRVALAVRQDAERALVDHAAVLSLDELAAVIRRAEAVLDPAGLAPKVADLRGERGLRIRRDVNGIIVLDGKFDSVTGAPIVAAIEGLVTQQLRTSRGLNQPGATDDAGRPVVGDPVAGDPAAGRAVGGRPVAGETRTIPQMNADALAALCAHALGCEDPALGNITTTVVVRMPLDALTTGVGVATIDGIEQPIDAGTARRMAASAAIIPCVLGTDGDVLDWGRAKRHFTKAQRLALVERDGGCAFCHLPPQFTEAHHIDWWTRDAGPTNLDNGILLCTACHHRVHDEGWGIRIDHPPGATAHPPGATRPPGATAHAINARVNFIPPAHIDPSRTPRTGGRYRFDPTHWHLTA